MLQRIQTLYLMAAVLLTAAMFFTPLFQRSMESPQGWIWISMIFCAGFSAALSIWAIVLYSQRKKQIKLIQIGMIFQTLLFGSGLGIVFSLGGIGRYLWDEALGAGLLLLALIAMSMAIRGIKKDEELVRSMDRIR